MHYCSMEDKPGQPGERPPRDTSPRPRISIWDTSAVPVRREREGAELEKPGREPGEPERRASPLAALTGPVPALLGGWIAAAALASFHSPITAVLVVLGLFGAFIAGLVGVGGAIVMIPLLLFVPPLFGADVLSMHTVAGVTMVQVAAAGVAGMLAHHGRERIDGSLVAVLGGAMMFGALGGAVLSRYVSPQGLEATFATLATAAAVLMLARRHPESKGGDRWDGDFNRPLSVMLGGGVGVLAGMVGAGGGFLLMPLMIHVLRIPLRAALGASLGVVALSGIAGAFGKAVSGQVDWLLALALVAGALPGAQIGALVSRRTRVQTLGVILGVFIALVAVRMWWGILR
jgi:uncharacterized membrane protein YfcA